MRTIIADDEVLARRLLRELLKEYPEIEIIAEAEDGDSALTLSHYHKADLLFLDIEMPGRTGLSVAAELQEAGGEVIFVTAHEIHAVGAFELGATDYLLKPVRRSRLAQALARAKERLAARQQRIHASQYPQAETASPGDNAFWVPVRNGVVRVAVTDIMRVIAARDLVYFYTKEHTYLYRTTMTELEGRLTGSGLIRAHRSSFIRPECVRFIRREGKRVYLEMDDGALVSVGPSYRDAVLSAI